MLGCIAFTKIEDEPTNEGDKFDTKVSTQFGISEIQLVPLKLAGTECAAMVSF